MYVDGTDAVLASVVFILDQKQNCSVGLLMQCTEVVVRPTQTISLTFEILVCSVDCRHLCRVVIIITDCEVMPQAYIFSAVAAA